MSKRRTERQKAQAQALRMAQRQAEEVEKERRRQAAAIEKERRRQEAAAEQARKRDERQAREVAAVERRLAERSEREQKRRRADEEKEQARRANEARQKQAAEQTAQVEARVAALDGLITGRQRDLRSQNARIEREFAENGSQAMADAVHKLVAASNLPQDFPSDANALFLPEQRQLQYETTLPNKAIVPSVTRFKYVKTRDAVEPIQRKEADIRRHYQVALSRLALRKLAEIFDAAPHTLVQSVVFNGHVDTKNKATGKPIRPCLLSIEVQRAMFDDLVLDEPELDPVQCLQYINALVSPHPYDFEPVKPVITIDLSKYKTIDDADAAGDLDGRMNLLDLTPTEFEHWVKKLFEAIGLETWQTQASRDDGVDAVAFNSDPVVGGECVIQAKRYKNIVGLESVHALAGTMDHLRATKGILVTTSWVGQASREFVSKHGRMEIIDGRELKSLFKEHLDINVRIGLPKVPPGWERRDVS